MTSLVLYKQKLSMVESSRLWLLCTYIDQKDVCSSDATVKIGRKLNLNIYSGN